MTAKSCIALPFALILLVAVSGCIRGEIVETIRGDGTSLVAMEEDYSKLYELVKQSAGEEESAAFRQNLTQSCTEFLKVTKLKNARCDAGENFVITKSGEYSPRESGALVVSPSIPYTTYKYDAKNIFGVLGNASAPQGQTFSEEALAQTKSQAALLGLDFKYTVVMPGEVTKKDIGEIKDKNNVVINLFDMVGRENLYVESQELNLFYDIPLVAAVGGFAFVIVRKKGSVSGGVSVVSGGHRQSPRTSRPQRLPGESRNSQITCELTGPKATHSNSCANSSLNMVTLKKR